MGCMGVGILSPVAANEMQNNMETSNINCGYVGVYTDSFQSYGSGSKVPLQDIPKNPIPYTLQDLDLLFTTLRNASKNVVVP